MDAARRISLALLFAATGLLGAAALAPFMQSSSAPLSLAADGLATSLFLGSLGLAGAALSSVPLGQRLGLGPSRISLPLLVLLVLGCLGTSHALDRAVDLAGARDSSTLATIDAAISGARGRDLLLLVLALGFGPGIGEELLFRGFVQRGFERRMGGALAVVLSALAFATVHLDVAHAVAAFPLGLYLGFVAWVAGSVRASICCHVANNVIAVLGTAFGAEAEGSAHPGVTLALGLGVAAAALWAASRQLRHAVASKPQDAGALS